MGSHSSRSSRRFGQSSLIADLTSIPARRQASTAAAFRAPAGRRVHASAEPLEARSVPSSLGLASLSSILPAVPLAVASDVREVLAASALGVSVPQGGGGGSGLTVEVDGVAALDLSLAPLVQGVVDAGTRLGAPVGNVLGAVGAVVEGATSGLDPAAEGVNLSIGGAGGSLGVGLSLTTPEVSLALPTITAELDPGGVVAPGPSGGTGDVQNPPGVPALPSGPTVPLVPLLPAQTPNPTIEVAGPVPSSPIVVPIPGRGFASGGTAPGSDIVNVTSPGPARFVVYGLAASLPAPRADLAPILGLPDDLTDEQVAGRANVASSTGASLAPGLPGSTQGAAAAADPTRSVGDDSSVDPAPAAGLASQAADFESAAGVPATPVALHLGDLGGLERALSVLQARLSHLGAELAEQVTPIGLIPMLLAAGLGCLVSAALRRLEQEQRLAQPRVRFGSTNLPGPFYRPRGRVARG